MSVGEAQRRQRQRQASAEEHESNKAAERERRRLLRIQKRQQALTAVTVAGRRRVLRLPEVEAVTGLKTSIIYELIEDDQFPAPIALTASARGWLETEIDQWLDTRIAERDGTTAGQ
jgi:prophage regulatory protein